MKFTTIMNIKFLLILFSFLSLFINDMNGQTKITKTDAEWKKALTPLQYEILRKKGTEYAFSGEYNKFYEEGIYHCAGCNTPLFTSESKFDSGTGWPSFNDHISNNVHFHEDNRYEMNRTEITCNVCDGHLGHFFTDKLKKRYRKRYCVNSLSLKFNNIQK
jgi:peptide-methionine (R)-S-oxide reductase